MARRVGPPGPYWRKPPLGPRSLAAKLTLAAFALAALALTFGGVLVEDPSHVEAAHPGKPGKVAFDSSRNGSTDIYTVNPDGSGLTRLTNKDPFDDDVYGPSDRSPSWSPDGKTIVFHSNRAVLEGTFRAGRSPGGADPDIWVMNADGSGMRNLTGDSTADETDPHFSFDGTKIVYERRAEPSYDGDIAIMNADGTGRTVLTNDSGANPPQEENPTFSQDGRIFFQSFDGQQDLQLFSMNADGTGRAQLTAGPGANFDPDVSPDAHEVVFISTRDNLQLGIGDVYLMNADGSNERRLLASQGNDSRPSFSPGGLRVTFAPGAPQFGIAFVETSGANFTSPVSRSPNLDDNAPDWQPIPYRCFGQNPTIVGSYDGDNIVGTSGPDVIVSLSKDDTIKGGKGADVLCGNWQNDQIFGGPGNDVLIGGPNKDELYGQGGRIGSSAAAPRRTATSRLARTSVSAAPATTRSRSTATSSSRPSSRPDRGRPAGAVPASAGQPAPTIVGGGPAAAAGWGFTVPLKHRKLGLICTASVISPTSLLTAAHCVKRTKPRRLQILEGSPWASGKRAGATVRVARIRIHPRYNGQKDRRDLAVLRLRRPTVAPPIALPTLAEARAATRPGTRVRSAGWGARSAWGFRAAGRLKSTRERVLTSGRCRRFYGKDGFFPPTMVCALGRRVGRFRGPHVYRTTTCSGDSGGPLVAATPGGPRLVGVTSVGPIPCGGGPSIYSRVAHGLRFIRRAME